MTLEQLFERARHLYELKEYGDAEAAVRAGLDLGPDFAPFHAILAMCLYFRGEWDMAEASGLRAVQLDPEFDRGYYALGVIFLSQDKPRLALQALERCLELAPQDVLAHAMTAHVLLYTEQWKPALARALEALSLDEDCTPAMEAYAVAQRALGEFAAAEELLVRFTTAHPNELGVVEQLGWVALERSNWGVALDCFGRAEVKEGMLETRRRQMPLYQWLSRFPWWFRLIAFWAGLGLCYFYPILVSPMLGLGFGLVSLRPLSSGYLWWRKVPLSRLEKAEFLICLGLGLVALKEIGRAHV